MNEVLWQLKFAVDDAVDLLAAYEGEKIVAGEHPIHKAIVKVESFCRERKSEKQPFSLPLPIARVWYALLDVSRGFNAEKRRPFFGSHFSLNEGVGKKAKELLPRERKRQAKLLALILAACLSGMMDALKLYDRAGNTLPFTVEHREKEIQALRERAYPI